MADSGRELTADKDIHPLLRDAFDTLDATGARWLLLRGADDVTNPTGDVDLLADPIANQELDSALSDVGFFRTAAPGHGSHRFYFGYDAIGGTWVKLDIVSSVTFGAFAEWQTGLADGCLQRRIRVDGLPRPTAEDEAWLLLLHLVLDKGGIASSRVSAAAAAAGLATEVGPIPGELDARAGSGSAGQLLACVRSGRFKDVPELADDLHRRAAKPLMRRGIELRTRVLRRLAGPTLAGRRIQGLKVAVMGPDGAGKTTLLHGIGDHFPVQAAYVYMGMWAAGPWDTGIHRVPGGRSAQKIYRIAKGGTVAAYHTARGRLVLLDRVAYDAMLPGSIDYTLGGRLTAALMLRFAPTLDLLFVLDAPAEVMFARKGEHTLEVLDRWRCGYLEIATRVPQSVVLDAARPAAEVRRDAVDTVWQLLTRGRR